MCRRTSRLCRGWRLRLLCLGFPFPLASPMNFYCSNKQTAQQEHHKLTEENNIFPPLLLNVLHLTFTKSVTAISQLNKNCSLPFCKLLLAKSHQAINTASQLTFLASFPHQRSGQVGWFYHHMRSSSETISSDGCIMSIGWWSLDTFRNSLGAQGENHFL